MQQFLPTTNATPAYLAQNYFTPGASLGFNEIRNDKKVGFSIQPVAQNLAGSQNPFIPEFETGDTFSMGVGLIDAAPTGGNVSLQVGATTSGLANLAYNIASAALQTALNAALTTESKPLCTVSSPTAGVYQIIAATNGAITDGLFSVALATLLFPTSDAFFVIGDLGSASTPYQVTFVMRQAPMCYAEPTDALPSADVQIVTLQAGAIDANKIQQISFTVEQVSAGGYTINATANAITASCGTATPLMTARQLGLILAQHPQINYQTTNAEDNIAVTALPGQLWNVEFIGTLADDDANELTVMNNDLVGPKGLSGEINYNTKSLYTYSLTQSTNPFPLTRSITRTRASGEYRTLYQGAVNIYKDMLDPSTAIPTPLPSYYTSAEVDGLLAANVTAANARFVRYDASQSLSGGEQTQALANAGGTTPTGTGAIVRATSPTLVTPALGAATATSVVASGNLSAGGDLLTTTAGKGLQIKPGSNARAGSAVLVAGTVTVANTTVTANTLLLLTRKTAGGTLGAGGYIYTVSAATSFTITSVDTAGSLSNADTSTLSYMLVEVN